MNGADEMHAYYSARAPHMAKNLSAPPTGQLQEIIAELQAQAVGKAVLEIACGTGYWTRQVALVARETLATDFSEEMLTVSRGQQIAHAQFQRQDAYRLTGVAAGRYDFGFAMHWVSHIPLARWGEFFATLHARLKPRARVLLADDIRRPDDADPYYSKVATRDSYEIRRLPEGGTYEIVKTYFTPEELRELLQPYAENVVIRYERPRWWLTYDVKRA